jgi:hypothetical protein
MPECPHPCGICGEAGHRVKDCLYAAAQWAQIVKKRSLRHERESPVFQASSSQGQQLLGLVSPGGPEWQPKWRVKKVEICHNCKEGGHFMADCPMPQT